ncbi:hypothetical protein TTHERM_000648731 (macronuclear) [Tetrahymena thermophila SB210]|uniref:Uncharacterized protein n=1 Tax=Tetrahymena thermophila (strain SB210) TaxID=312017 RepID=W7XJN6_TETTS|nr:hypothetical protein TTHERM_000648731 [Tetrahymena thermophila SB210]EWS74284.1 hypothetical protein TTHERM_000648731 [Tetrahymena thermophila SB210]|eukprot:XP_012653172.1 hypothetical protein TTHERM_000648731 [Tetrahymena thermophila SB210]
MIESSPKYDQKFFQEISYPKIHVSMIDQKRLNPLEKYKQTITSQYFFEQRLQYSKEDYCKTYFLQQDKEDFITKKEKRKLKQAEIKKKLSQMPFQFWIVYLNQ